MANSFKIIFLGFFGAFLFHLVKPIFTNESHAAPSKPVLTASGLNIIDSKGRIRFQIGFAQEGSPALWIFDEKGTVRFNLGLYPDGTSFVGHQDKEGRMIQLQRAFGEKESPLLIFKNQGQDVMIMGLNGSDSKPFLYQAGTNVFGKYGQ